MKTFMIWVTMLLICLCIILIEDVRKDVKILKRASVTDEATPAVESAKEGYSFEDLLDAIEWVESKGDASATGDDGKAVGSFQIWEIYVDDVNRIIRLHSKIKPLYVYMDRYNREMSRTMATIYLKRYGGTFEEMARKHNGGPNGHKKESTKPYWEKVKAYMERPVE